MRFFSKSSHIASVSGLTKRNIEANIVDILWEISILYKNKLKTKKMASKNAKELKKKFIEMDSDDFEPLTFGELEVGEVFIGLPFPGDNKGHGGLRNTYCIFRKTQHVTSDNLYSKDLGEAKNFRKVESKFPHSMLVIKLGEWYFITKHLIPGYFRGTCPLRFSQRVFLLLLRFLI